MRISKPEGSSVWRKLLIVCLFGILSWKSAEAHNGPFPSSAPLPLHQPALDSGSADASVTRRIALVIGNENYRTDPLRSPANDARAVGAALASLGFEVMRYENLGHAGMMEALDRFQQNLADGGIGLFYFAGHGFQTGGTSMLAAIDADSRQPRSLVANSVDLRSVLERMSAPRPGKLNLVILDTCLNNPFDAASTADLPLPDRTIIVAASPPGGTAIDGDRHGAFTAELLKTMLLPGLHIEDAMREAVRNNRQLAIQRNTASPASVHAGGTAPLAVNAVDRPPRLRAILPKDSAEQYELAFWDSIKDSNHAADYEAYLQAYPKGRFAALAKARIERLRAAESKAAPPPQERPAPAAKTPERPQPAPAAKAAPERSKPAEKKEPPKEPPATAGKEAPKQASPAAAAPSTERSSGGDGRVAELRDCPTCPVLVSLPGGSYTMGSNSGDPSEKPAHQVSISGPFAIGKHEVTVEQWNACVEDGGCPRITSDANRTPSGPVRDVSWDDAQQYVKWLSKVSGKPYRLPTEAEWEFAARGGTSTRYWWGEQMRPGKANCKDCGEPWSQDGPANVGSFAANPFGLHDVNGSVWEWVSDCWHNSYKGAPDDGRSWDASACRERVIRGGSWRDGASYMPASTRFKYAASVRHSQNGFRVARDLK